MVETRDFDRIAALGLWIYISFSILQMPNYFPEPLNFEAIGMVTVGFIFGWVFYTRRVTKASLPSMSGLRKIAQVLADIGLTSGMLFAIIRALPTVHKILYFYGSPGLLTGITLPFLGVKFGLPQIVALVFLLITIGFSMALGFAFAFDAIGTSTGEWRLWVRSRKSRPKRKTQEEIEDERTERIISGVLRRLKEDEDSD